MCCRFFIANLTSDPITVEEYIAPRGSQYPKSRVSRSKNHSEYGFWDFFGTQSLAIWVLGPSGLLRSGETLNPKPPSLSASFNEPF